MLTYPSTTPSRSVLRGGVGSQIIDDAFQTDAVPTRESLDHLATLGTDLLLPGQGKPWTRPAPEAVDLVSSRG